MNGHTTNKYTFRNLFFVFPENYDERTHLAKGLIGILK